MTKAGLRFSNCKQLLQLPEPCFSSAVSRYWLEVISFFALCSYVLHLFFLSFLCRGLFLPPAQVTADRNKTAVRGKKAFLSCSYGLPEKVEQVIWRHSPQQGDSAEVASFAKQSDPMIEPPYQGRVWLSTSLSDSQLTIQPVTIQDEGCYTCVYSTHADGPKSSTVCLSTYGNHHLSSASLIVSLVVQTTKPQILLLIITHKWCYKNFIS